MAHNLTVRQDGLVEMFSGSGITPWHKLGQRIEGLATAKEAIKLARLDWQVALEQVYVRGNVVEDAKAVVRQDNGKVLSILGNRYNCIQNEESFEFFDEVVGSGQAIYDTAGSLQCGKKVWIMAKLKGNLFLHNRPNDILEKNVLLSTSHDGSSSLSMQIVGTRVVCANTLSIALNGAMNQIKIRHTKSYISKKDEAMKALGLCNAYFDDLQSVINELDSQAMSEIEMESFAIKLIPSTNDEESTKTLSIRSEIVDLFSHGKGNVGRTKWDAINAVTEYVDHNRGTKTSENSSKEESRFISSMFTSGANLKAKAYSLLVS